MISCQSQESNAKLSYFEIKYRFKQKDVGQGRFRVAHPQSIYGTQEIHDVILDPKPSQLVTQGDEKYGEFIFVSPKDSIIELNLKQYFNNPSKSSHLNSIQQSHALKAERYLEYTYTSFLKILQPWSQSSVTTKLKNDDVLDSTFEFVEKFMTPSEYLWKDQELLKTIQKRSGVCTECTDLTVALFRHHKIPAIANSGFAYLDGKAQAHSFAQCDNGWMDPLLLKRGNQTPAPTIVLSSTRNPEYLIGKRFLDFDWAKGNLQMLGFPQIQFYNMPSQSRI